MKILTKNRQRKILIDKNQKIKIALERLNSNKDKILFVVEKENKILGSLTDGDIRRGFLKNLNFDSNVISFCNTKPEVINKNKNLNYKKMIKKNITLIPKINQKNEILCIYETSIYDNNVETKNNEFIIMAGGLGTRLKPFTNKIPKALIKVKGIPLIERIILNASKFGFINFTIILFHEADKIIKYLGNGKKFNVNINYHIEKKPQGTIGGIFNLKNKIREPFLVTNCDVVSDVNYSELLKSHLEAKKIATFSINKKNHSYDFGVFNLNKNLEIINFVEKPKYDHFINSGVYVFEETILNFFKKNIKMNINELINHLIKNKSKLNPFFIHENWTDLGRIKQIEQFKE